ncbi:cupin-like domain-containing protein [Sphingomonas panacisoli]|uniref:Cupin-like domain-containing protein n=1 Tax=Sphingomonas panacisoli TaxID=1813879 RepID=A0A5B8LH94_9SPHN|nr:cupin-like domain-containing protein [Sphingomonas panacisoli]QDZ07391.1 cupin-like domain-containing protein [Sphingomonas panacisoli]
MQPVAERPLPDAAAFAAISDAGEPVVMRGLVADWPVVVSAQRGELANYLTAMANDVQLAMVRSPASEEGRLHYSAAVDRPNFNREPASIADFFAALDQQADAPAPDRLAIQGVAAEQILPGFAAANPMPLLPPDVEPRLWLGTAAIVATHHDQVENIACVAAGRRRFTLFPPEQVANLYMGPFHLTPAGTAVSMAHVTQPDLDRFPGFADALADAQTVELEPGDAIYIPYGWYHHVEALSPLNLLVNYWWNPARRDVGSPWDALMHGMIALRQLPPAQRRSWRAMFDHYVFKSDVDPAAHLPEAARGILGAESPADLAMMRQSIIAALQKTQGSR